MSIAPFFSARARQRRVALKALRSERAGSQVELVMPYPLPELAAGEYHEPQLLVASPTEVSLLSLDRSRVHSTAAWGAVPPIEVGFAEAPTMIAVMRVGAQHYVGVDGSGMFGLSPSRLRRMARRIERMRPR